eukprot:CAMPEP_0179138144 /NCGR_PEP_ID=MMETSP0796-20121207/65953_1 /TAXON_ID=73915 /ORGANISM="Pyrodinium bahamense, Strain pbaha01" /LENGTH=46 /DNA_ID= /DNA_START= /DNA_END= /DNA_ORIENTATION=
MKAERLIANTGMTALRSEAVLSAVQSAGAATSASGAPRNPASLPDR